jgi:hypothetical protein
VTDSRELRIGDSDRDQISEVLSEHAAEGRLTMDELDQRIGVLYEAKTRAQAAAVVADLPPLVASEVSERFSFEDAHEHVVPELPAWLNADWHTANLSPTRPAHPSQDRAAMRKRAKLRQDENAIGHTFQATRRAINAELETATASGQADEIERLKERLQRAQAAEVAARQAVSAMDRAEVQRRLGEMRGLR